MPKLNYVKLEGGKELYVAIKRLGALPQKVVTPAAKKGARIWLKAVKANAPVGETGELRKGIILHKERYTKKGKAVYDTMMDPEKNDIFAKTHTASANAAVVRNNRAKAGDTVRAYYPASQEYGFMTRNGGYVPGYHFMRNSATDNAKAAETVIVKEMAKRVDKEWAKNNA